MTKEIIKASSYPHSLFDISFELDGLHQYPALACDIETTSLDIARAKITTIAFAWSEHEGISFCVSRDQSFLDMDEIKNLLRNFFESYQGALVYHNASYDICILIRELYTDQLEGLQVFTKNIHDTKLITYLATNNTSINNLGLKDLSKEFTGDYAVDFKSGEKIETPVLLEYNLIDTLATVWVFKKYYPIMQEEDQEAVYQDIFIPSLINIIHMQMNGLPIDMNQIQETKRELEAIRNQYVGILNASNIVTDYEWQLKRLEYIKANKKLKRKVKSISDFDHIKFNPNSGPQIAGLLYNTLKFPVTNKTEKGNPATDKDTLNEIYKSLLVKYDINEDDL